MLKVHGRNVQSAAVTLATFVFATACSLVYSSYDNRFGDASVAPLVTDDSGAKIAGMVVSSSGLFFYVEADGGAAPYTTAPAIKRVSVDGGGLAPFWEGDASVVGLATDGVDMLAWVAGTEIWEGSASSPSSAGVVPSGLDGGLTLHANAPPIVADSTHVAWLGNIFGGPTCPPTGCIVGAVAPWSGSAATLTTAGALPANAGNTSPHTLAIGPSGVLVDFDSNGAGHWVAHFGSSGGAATCAVSLQSLEAQLMPPTGGIMYAEDVSQSLSAYALSAAGCPTTPAPNGVTDQAVVALTVDSAGSYWVEKSGNVLSAQVGATSGVVLGSIGVPSSKAPPIAVDATSVYVASGSSIFSFSKSPRD